MAQVFYDMLNGDAAFELPVKPQSNIVCFRYIKPKLDDKELNKLNASIRQKVIESGKFYIVQTELNGKIHLRCTIINPFTSEKELSGLMEYVKHLGKISE